MNVERRDTSQSKDRICENSIRYDVMSATMATVFNRRFTSIMRQQQKTIIAHIASPHAAGIFSIWRDNRPNTTNAIALKKYIRRLREDGSIRSFVIARI